MISVYAHRGLHSDVYPENSLGAVMQAVDKGLPVEIDIRLTSDNVPIVFHDKSLKRLTGINGVISDLKFSEIKNLKLLGSNEKIPSLEDLLNKVSGAVPLLIELKPDSAFSFSHSLEKSVIKLLEDYSGEYKIQSFYNSNLNYFKKKSANTECGLLVKNDYPFKSSNDFINIMLAGLTTEKIKNLRKRYPSIIAWVLDTMSIDEAVDIANKFKIDGIVCDILITEPVEGDLRF